MLKALKFVLRSVRRKSRQLYTVSQQSRYGLRYYDTTVAENHTYMNNEAEDATLEWCGEIGCKFIEDAIHKLVARYGERLQGLTRNCVTKT